MNQEKIFTEIFLPLYGHMFRAAMAILGRNSPEAADAVQEAMVKIWKSGAALSRVENPEGYAISAVRSSAIDILRKRHSSENIEDILNLSDGHPPDHDSGDFIERIIASLPVAQQEVIRLSAYERLLEYVSGTDFSSDEAYEQLQELMDVQSFTECLKCA